MTGAAVASELAQACAPGDRVPDDPFRPRRSSRSAVAWTAQEASTGPGA